MIRLRNLIPGNLLGFCLLAILAMGSAAQADGPVQVDASNAQGPLCAFLVKQVVPPMTGNENQTFTVPSSADALAAAPKLFDPSVIAKVQKTFADPKGLGELIDSLAGQTFTPASLSGLIAQQLEKMGTDTSKIGLDAVSVAPFIGILSGAGVTIKWIKGEQSDEYGYKFDDTSDPTSLAKDVKSGRGFGMTVDRQYLDASDSFILKAADAYFSKGTENQLFYQTLFEIMTKMDTSGIAKLSPEGQALMIDFLTVFTAEFSRSSMAQFKSHPWHKDLLAVFLLAPYVTKAQQISIGRKVQAGNLEKFFAVGTAGSGIGETRNDREDLQQGITGYLKANAAANENVVQRIGELIGKTDSKDIFQDSIDYLTNPDGQADVTKNAAELIALLADLESYIGANAGEIAGGLQSQIDQLPPRPARFAAAPKQASAAPQTNAAPPAKVSPRANFNQGPTSADQARARFTARRPTPRTLPRSSTNGN